MKVTQIGQPADFNRHVLSFKENTDGNALTAGYNELNKLAGSNDKFDSSNAQTPLKKSSTGKWVTSIIVLLALGAYFYKKRGGSKAAVENAAKEIAS